MSEMEKTQQYDPQKLSTVYTGNLLSGMPYQRPVKDWKVNKLVREWDDRLAGPVTVSRRDGKLYLVDGQNRVAALRRMNGDKDLMVPCRMHYGLSYAEEAELCWKLDQAKSRLTLAQSITALKEAGTDEEISAILRLMEVNGFKWTLDKDIPGEYEIRAARAVLSAYRLLGQDAFDRMLRLLAGAWQGAPSSLKGGFLSGMALFVKTYETELVDRTAIKRLSAIDPEEVVRRGKTDFSTNRAALRYARVLWKKYNCQRGGRKLAYRFKIVSRILE